MSGAIALKLRPVEPIRVERLPDRPIAIERTTQTAPQIRLSGLQVIEIDHIPAGPTRFDQLAAAGTWIIAHGLGHVPQASVFLASGEQVFPDVTIDALHITVTFASPEAGFVLAS